MPPAGSSSSTPVRMIDIAQRAGVSRMAVSAVLMGTGGGRIGVGAETAERIRRIADELGYRPNSAAQQLAGKRSGVIAVIANDWRNFLAQRILVWLHEAAEKHGFRILATRSHDSFEPIEQLLRDMRSGWVDGIVYVAHENERQWPAVVDRLAQIPNVVTVGGDLRVPGVSSVISDVTSGARASMTHLRTKERRHPVLIAEDLELPAMQARITAYCDAATEHGIGFDRSRVIHETQGWVISNPEHYARFDQLAQTVVKEFHADSVLCDTDFTAVGLLRAFRRLGVSVPQDLAVIGWGDLQFAAAFDPPITTVTHQLSELLNRVVDNLQHQLESGTGAGAIELIDTNLIIRETT